MPGAVVIDPERPCATADLNSVGRLLAEPGRVEIQAVRDRPSNEPHLHLRYGLGVEGDWLYVAGEYTRRWKEDGARQQRGDWTRVAGNAVRRVQCEPTQRARAREEWFVRQQPRRAGRPVRRRVEAIQPVVVLIADADVDHASIGPDDLLRRVRTNRPGRLARRAKVGCARGSSRRAGLWREEAVRERRVGLEERRRESLAPNARHPSYRAGHLIGRRDARGERRALLSPCRPLEGNRDVTLRRIGKDEAPVHRTGLVATTYLPSGQPRDGQPVQRRPCSSR